MTGTETEKSRLVLRSLSEGLDVAGVLARHADVTSEDVRAAAAEALRALERGARPETRAERIERLREQWPQAYAPWTEEEDARLVQRWDEGARVVDLSRELGRPPNAVRLRLEKHLGASWRERGAAARARSSAGPSAA